MIETIEVILSIERIVVQTVKENPNRDWHDEGDRVVWSFPFEGDKVVYGCPDVGFRREKIIGAEYNISLQR